MFAYNVWAGICLILLMLTSNVYSIDWNAAYTPEGKKYATFHLKKQL